MVSTNLLGALHLGVALVGQFGFARRPRSSAGAVVDVILLARHRRAAFGAGTLEIGGALGRRRLDMARIAIEMMRVVLGRG